jgi:hypothetical protein
MKPCAPRHLWNLICQIFVRAFRPDGFACLEFNEHFRPRYIHALALFGAQMHLDTPLLSIPARFMCELFQIEVGS